MAIESISAAAAYQGSMPIAGARAAEQPIPAVTPAVEVRPVEKTGASTGSDETGNSQEQREELANQNGQIQKAVEEINKKNPQTEAVFGIHDGTNRVTIKIVDKESKKVIKEYPPEKTLDMIEKVWEMAGIMVDEKR